MSTFDPHADIIDLRDVISVAEGDLADEEADTEHDLDARAFISALLSDLGYPTGDDDQAMIEQAREIADGYEATIIARSYFVEYAQELANDIGAVDASAGWPTRHINWKAAADELEADYSTFDYEGREYLIRSF